MLSLWGGFFVEFDRGLSLKKDQGEIVAFFPAGFSPWLGRIHGRDPAFSFFRT
jgi:hypothetical protein